MAVTTRQGWPNEINSAEDYVKLMKRVDSVVAWEVTDSMVAWEVTDSMARVDLVATISMVRGGFDCGSRGSGGLDG